MSNKQRNFQDNEKSIIQIRFIMSRINQDQKKEEVEMAKMMVKANIFDIKKDITYQLEHFHTPEVQHLYNDQLRRIQILEDILSKS
jgi:hypothetical protein